MIATPIDQLKQQYTDKYVVVDAQRPELARFRDVVGQVRTVNMSGRALVEFDEYHLNIGWYDIDLAFLKVVDKPAPKPKAPAAKKPAAKPAAKPSGGAAAAGKKLSPLEMARAQGAAGKGGAPAAKPAGDKPSTADILAAARGGKAAPAATPDKAVASEAPAKVDRAKMTVEQMLAAARGQGTAAPPATEAAPPPAAPAEPAATAPAAKEPAAEAPAPAKADKVDKVDKVDRASMSVDDMIAWCREHDAN